MKQFAQRAVAVACLVVACTETQAKSEESIVRALNSVTEESLNAPLDLKVAGTLSWKAPGEARLHASLPGDSHFGDVSTSSMELEAWPPSSRQDFLAVIWPHAERVAKEIGVTPHAVAAQAALESGWGQRLAKTAKGHPTFNLFGIKAGPSWTGERVQVATHEYVRGKKKPDVADFRAYESIEHAFADYLNMLRANDRYSKALKHGGTSRHFASRLQKAGYSTDPHYAKKIYEIANSKRVKKHARGLQ
jgi:peptidoglycan hydrolase FlgJ